MSETGAPSTTPFPTDIPWRRLCTNEEWIDRTVCDRDHPPRWASSIAVFSYEPPEADQTLTDVTVTYYKVAATITGYQPEDAKEISALYQRELSYWRDPAVGQSYLEAVSRYYGCYGAVLEITLTPSTADAPLDDYPYVLDFSPKKRELYELVTATGESLSRSIEEVHVQEGKTTSAGVEVVDADRGVDWASLGTAAGGIAGGAATGGNPLGIVAGSALGGALGGMLGGGGSDNPRSISDGQRTSLRTADSVQEMSERLSYTTRLAQMYHQFTGYHVGTNRAVFLMLPRPHIVQTEHTFVNGPRVMEGLQEVFLIVARPKSVQRLCVSAVLETAHIAFEEGLYEKRDDEVRLDIPATFAGVVTKKEIPNQATKLLTSKSLTWSPPGDWEIDDFRHGTKDGVPTPGYNIGYLAEPLIFAPDFPSLHNKQLTAHDFDVKPGQDPGTLEITGRAGMWKATSHLNGYWTYNGGVSIGGHVYLRRKDTVPETVPSTLFLTSREVCCCPAEVGDPPAEGLTAEVLIHPPGDVGVRYDAARGISIKQANLIQARVGQLLVESRMRRRPGPIRMGEAQFVALRVARAIIGAGHPDNDVVTDIAGLRRDLAERLSDRRPGLRRADLLRMPVEDIEDRFALDRADAGHVLRASLGLEAPSVPPDRRWDRNLRREVTVPDIIGLLLNEALSILVDVGLSVGLVEERDSEQPTGVVLAQVPGVDATARRGDRVDIVTATGLSVRIPAVIGRSLSAALCALGDAGLRTEPTITFQSPRDAVRHQVLSIEPSPGTYVTPHHVVQLEAVR